MDVNAALRVALTALVVGGIGGAPFALAQDTFQAEAGLSYTRAKSKDSRQDTALLQGNYFFDTLPLQPRDYPLEQVPFVERASGLTAYYSRGFPDIEGVETIKDPWSYNLAVQVTPPDMPLILGVGYGSSYSGRYRYPFGTGSYDTETDVKSYQLRVGSYVDKTTAVTLDWSRSDGKGKITPSITSGLTYTSTSVGISGLHLMRVANGDHIAILANISQTTFDPEGAVSEKNRSYLVQTTYYPAQMLGFWLGIQVDRGDTQAMEGEVYMVGANMFVTQAVSFGLIYQRFLRDALDNRGNAVSLSGGIRF